MYFRKNFHFVQECMNDDSNKNNPFSNNNNKTERSRKIKHVFFFSVLLEDLTRSISIFWFVKHFTLKSKYTFPPFSKSACEIQHSS